MGTALLYKSCQPELNSACSLAAELACRSQQAFQKRLKFSRCFFLLASPLPTATGVPECVCAHGAAHPAALERANASPLCTYIGYYAARIALLGLSVIQLRGGAGGAPTALPHTSQRRIDPAGEGLVTRSPAAVMPPDNGEGIVADAKRSLYRPRHANGDNDWSTIAWLSGCCKAPT